MMIKKWLSILIVLGFASTYVYAADDDWEEEEEEEEEPVKKSSKKKPAKKSSDSAPGRIGLSVSFSGEQKTIGLVYDFGSGMELGLGLGYASRSWTPVAGDVELDAESRSTWSFVPSLSFELGKSLLSYGLGVSAIVTSSNEANKDEAVMDIFGYPNFYVSAELVKNVSLGLNAGVLVKKGGDLPNEHARLDFGVLTSASLTFYFL